MCDHLHSRARAVGLKVHTIQRPGLKSEQSIESHWLQVQTAGTEVTVEGLTVYRHATDPMHVN